MKVWCLRLSFIQMRSQGLWGYSYKSLKGPTLGQLKTKAKTKLILSRALTLSSYTCKRSTSFAKSYSKGKNLN
jgi:hypothetical protein